MKPYKKGFFEFDIPIYDRWIAVFVGVTHKEAVALAKKQKYSKAFIESLNSETAKELCEKVADKESQTEGAVCRINDTHYFLFLQPYKNNWKYLDILNHECFHLTQFMGHLLLIWDEREPPAYLHSWMFKELRKRLSGVKKI